MNKTPTVHNPTNFKPEDYEVVVHLDGQPPQPFWGEAYESFRARLKEHEDEITRWLPSGKSHRCEHCGHYIRYIAVCLHKPTATNVAFGEICAHDLRFDDRVQYQAARVRARALAAAERTRLGKACEAFLSTRPDLLWAFNESRKPIHTENAFLHNVFDKFLQYGNLSDRQAECVIESIVRDYDKAARKAAEALVVRGDAPSGRVRVKGTVIATKTVENPFGYRGGVTTKFLVELENKSKVWSTVPSSLDCEGIKGAVVEFTATFTVSDKDKSFAFASRPTKGIILTFAPKLDLIPS